MEPKQLTYDICRCYFDDLSSQVAPQVRKRIDGLLRSKHIAGLSACSSLFDEALHTVNTWRFLRQIECFFKKNLSFTSENSAEVAWNSFLESERQCSATNFRLDYCYHKRDHLDPDLVSQLELMKSYISRVLGDFRVFLDELPVLVRVTPGATSTSKRSKSLPQQKMKMKIFAPVGARRYLRALYKYYGFNVPKTVACEVNRVESVPKNFLTDRTIGCEPEGALPLQLAFDTYVKKRLKKFGIDLSDQSANQKAALQASVDGLRATVDFERASDTVAYAPVAWLFPDEWWQYLCAVRSSKYVSKQFKAEGTYAKFSSMGNGSTFCIETLLFAAACYAVDSDKFLVYGDDVIIETWAYDEFRRLANFLGFTINYKKTHVDGPIRESCGLEAFMGINVTPVYIRHIDGRKAVLCHLVNTLASICIKGGKLERLLRGLIVTHDLPYVPYNESSISGVWLHPDDPLIKKVVKTRNYISKFKAFVPQAVDIRFSDSRGYYLWFLSKNGLVKDNLPWLLLTKRFDRTRMHVRRSTLTSSAPTFNHKYVRKWVCWHKPATAIPQHLFWW